MLQPRKSRYPSPPPSIVLSPRRGVQAYGSPAPGTTQASPAPSSVHGSPALSYAQESPATSLAQASPALTSSVSTSVHISPCPVHKTGLPVPCPVHRPHAACRLYEETLEDRLLSPMRRLLAVISDSPQESPARELPLRVGPALANEMYLGGAELDEQTLTVLQSNHEQTILMHAAGIPPHAAGIPSHAGKGTSHAGLTNGQTCAVKPLQASQQTERHQRRDSQQNGLSNQSARQQFYDNYLCNVKTKKKVTFSLPQMERDISDISISSRLSSISDCAVLDDDDSVHDGCVKL